MARETTGNPTLEGSLVTVWTGSRWSGQRRAGGIAYRRFIAKPGSNSRPGDDLIKRIVEAAAKKLGSPFSGYHIARIGSDRNIVPEQELNQLELKPDGTNATTIIRRYIHEATRPSELIEATLLNELNKVFEPDWKFEGITVQKNSKEGQSPATWEVYLKQPVVGGRFAHYLNVAAD